MKDVIFAFAELGAAAAATWITLNVINKIAPFLFYAN